VIDDVSEDEAKEKDSDDVMKVLILHLRICILQSKIMIMIRFDLILHAFTLELPGL
jgi:hypothetical protein